MMLYSILLNVLLFLLASPATTAWNDGFRVPHDDESSTTNVNAQLPKDYIYSSPSDRNPLGAAKLTPSSSLGNDAFGDHNAVAISCDLNEYNNEIPCYVVVGAPGDERYLHTRGNVYVYALLPGEPINFTQIAVLNDTDGQTGDHFGRSVGIYRDTIVVGANQDGSGGIGAAYIFQIIVNDNNSKSNCHHGTRVTQVAKITASDSASGTWFGESVAIEGNTIAVGAIFDNDEKRNEKIAEQIDDRQSEVGSVYIYTRSSDTEHDWSEVTKLKPSDGVFQDMFAACVAASGDTIVVGTYYGSAVYVFHRKSVSSNEWSEVAKLNPPPRSELDDGETGHRSSLFGSSVAVAGNHIVVGAPWDDNENGPDAGAVYVYKSQDLMAWTQIAKLVASNRAANEGKNKGANLARGNSFGLSVAISDDASMTVVTARRGNDGDGNDRSGLLHVFQRDETSDLGWKQMGDTASNGYDGNFGISLAISSKLIVVGDPYDDENGNGIGSAYVFDAKKIATHRKSNSSMTSF